MENKDEEAAGSSPGASDDESRKRLFAYYSKVIAFHPVVAARDWEDLRKTVPFLSADRLSRLSEAFAPNVGWIVVEDHYIDRDYRDTFSNTFSKRFATPPARCQRLHFFGNHSRKDFTDLTIPKEDLQELYLGYAVIRPTRPNGLGRTFVAPRIALDSARKIGLCLCNERVTFFGIELQIRGFPFIGQDVDVTTCAQSTLWMIRRYYSNRYSQYSETHPNALSRMAALRMPDDRALPATGLNDAQMAEMLRALGFSPKVYLKSQFRHEKSSATDGGQEGGRKVKPGDDGRIHFMEILLSYLDSGMPLVLSFSPDEKRKRPGHSVACIGVDSRSHYLRAAPASGKGAPPPEPLAYRTSAVIVGDDNYAPYLRVDDGAPPSSYPLAPRLADIESMIVPLPQQINILAEEFDLQVREIIKGATRGTEKFALAVRSRHLTEVQEAGKLALRCYLTSCRNFKQGLAGRQCGQDPFVATAYRLMPLPHFVWICELHDVRLPWDERCLGEIVWDSTCNKHERQGLLALHYPEFFALNAEPGFENRVTADDSQGWLEIELQPGSSPAYSPGVANLADI